MWNDFIELNLFVKFYFKKKSIDFKSFKKSKTQNEIWFAKKKNNKFAFENFKFNKNKENRICWFNCSKRLDHEF